MKVCMMIGIAGFALALIATAAFAGPPSSVCSVPAISALCTHPAPAPLLAAGIPAFAALGGGLAVRWMRSKFTRRV
jgi:hypothetical protein